MKKYRDDYEMVAMQDENGQETLRPVYRGVYFEVSLEEPSLHKLRRTSLGLAAGILILQIAAGFLNNPGMYQFYISLPYVFSFLFLFYLAQGIWRIPKQKRPYRRQEVDLSFNRMKSASRMLLVMLVIGILGEIFFLTLNQIGDYQGLELVYLLLEVLAAVMVFMQMRIQQPLIVHSIPGYPPIE